MATVVTLAARPDLVEAVRDLDTGWPEFMKHDAAGWSFASLSDAWPEYQLALLDDAGTLIGFARTGPIPWDGSDEGLADQGWDDAAGICIRAHISPRETTTACAFEASLLPSMRGTGLARALVEAMRENTRRLGHAHLVAPVRPNAKQHEPHTAMQEYAFRVREDGLPFDPWLRVHVRCGGRIVKVCPAAMAIAGSLRQWREWTGMPFDSDGDIDVPGALAPVNVSLLHDRAVYVEPNVWVHHRI